MALVKQGLVTRVYRRITAIEIDGERYAVTKYGRIEAEEGDQVIAQVTQGERGLFVSQLIVEDDVDGE